MPSLNLYNRTGAVAPIAKAVVASLLAFSMLSFPQQTFQAAFRGLDAWWSIVFPALLPFFVMSEILMGLGVVHFMGVLLEPVMRPLFNVPGCGAFVMAMGYTSGAPIGTLLSVELRKKDLCTRVEAQRLMSFTNNSSPLFLFGAVSVGMFHNPALGVTLAVSHYVANIIVGLILRSWGKDEFRSASSDRFTRGNIILNAFRALAEAQKTDNRPLGMLLGDAIKKSAQTLSMIGGFIIFFSVLIELLKLMGILDLLASILLFVLSPLGLHAQVGPALATGFFEITLGTKLASETPVHQLMQVVSVSTILGWGGLSIHAQVASLLKGTDIKMRTFVFARAMHSIIAPVITIVLMGWLQPVIAGTMEKPASLSGISAPPSWLSIVSFCFLTCLLLCAVACFAAILFQLVRTLKVMILRKR